MSIAELHVAGYRSVRDIRLKLGRVNVLVGPNGCGKTNLYRSVVLLAAAASGQLAQALVEEGGMPSVLWAGKRKSGPVRMLLPVTLDTLQYELTCGLPVAGHSLFDLDPQVKEECVWLHEGRRRIPLLERGRGSATARNADGGRAAFLLEFGDSVTALSQLREPHRFPHLSVLREEITAWRFYHDFRTDVSSPLRQSQVGVRTPVLSQDGRDLAAALQTIRENGDGVGLNEEIERAFPGAELAIAGDDGVLSLLWQVPGIRRPFHAQELSDGTLRYLCLLAALLSPAPPPLLALNEPEASIHPDLLEPLAGLILRASQHSQLWITTHSPALAAYIGQGCGASPIELEKVDGETRVVGQPQYALD